MKNEKIESINKRVEEGTLDRATADTILKQLENEEVADVVSGRKSSDEVLGDVPEELPTHLGNIKLESEENVENSTEEPTTEKEG